MEDTVALEAGDVRIRISEVAGDLPVVLAEGGRALEGVVVETNGHAGKPGRSEHRVRVGPGHELGHVHDADAAEGQRESGHDQPAR